MIWRVRMKFSYMELFFDFDNIEDAATFCTTVLRTYNKEATGENKDVYISLIPVQPESDEEEQL